MVSDMVAKYTLSNQNTYMYIMRAPQSGAESQFNKARAYGTGMCNSQMFQCMVFVPLTSGIIFPPVLGCWYK